MKDLRGIVLRGGWGGRGFGVREVEKWGSNMRKNSLGGEVFIICLWQMKVCTCVLLDFCSKVIVSGNHNYRGGHWELAAMEESSEICT